MYLISLCITLILEGPIVWFAYRKVVSSFGLFLMVFLFTNCFTHGTLWSTWSFISGAYAWKTAFFETLIWLVEAVIYRVFFRGSSLRALTVSFAANLTSLAGGFIYWIVVLKR